MLGQDRAGLNLQTPQPLAACMLLILKMDSFCGNGRDTTGRHYSRKSYMGARSQVSGMLDQLDQLDRRFDISTFHIFV